VIHDQTLKEVYRNPGLKPKIWGQRLSQKSRNTLVRKDEPENALPRATGSGKSVLWFGIESRSREDFRLLKILIFNKRKSRTASEEPLRSSGVAWTKSEAEKRAAGDG